MKDSIYSIVVSVAAFGVALFGAYIQWKNRQNSLREHLYKEQIAFFIKLRRLFTDLKERFVEIQLEPNDEIFYEQSFDLIGKVKILLDAEGFLIKNEILSSINRTIQEAIIYYEFLDSNRTEIESTQGRKFSDAVNDMENEIRMFMRIDALTKENESVIGKKSKVQSKKVT